jgi:hypothetical protein
MAGLGLDTTSDIIPQERKKKTRFETAQVVLLVAMIVFFTYSVFNNLYLLEVGKPLINMHH